MNYVCTIIIISGWLETMTGLKPSDFEFDGSSPQTIEQYEFKYYPRQMWNAEPPKEITPLDTSVPYVTIHDSYVPEACYDFETCADSMRTLQRIHMDQNNLTDIGYSFVVCSDGAIYEGRGFETMPSHAKNFNYVSLGICLLGDWSKTSPPEDQLLATQALIGTGVKEGFIHPDYRLIGHRQLSVKSKCPGDALYREIKSWYHYSNFPAVPKHVLDVPEVPVFVKEKVNDTLAESLRMAKNIIDYYYKAMG